MRWMTVFRIASISFALALAIVGALWALGSGSRHVGDLNFFLFLPAIVVAGLLSGNIHSVSTAVVFAAAVVEVFAVVVVVVIVVRLLRRPGASGDQMPR